MTFQERIKKSWEKLSKRAAGQFAVYQDRIQTDSIPRWIWHLDGRFFLRLMGVNLSKGKTSVDVEPFYIPFIAWSSTGRQHALELYLWRESSTVLFFLNAWPYLWLQRDCGMKMVEVDEED